MFVWMLWIYLVSRLTTINFLIITTEKTSPKCRFIPVQLCVCVCVCTRTPQASPYTNCSEPSSTRLKRGLWTPELRKPSTPSTTPACWATMSSILSWWDKVTHTFPHTYSETLSQRLHTHCFLNTQCFMRDGLQKHAHTHALWCCHGSHTQEQILRWQACFHVTSISSCQCSHS